MATAIEPPNPKDFTKQSSQLSISTVNTVDSDIIDIDSIVNKCWKYDEIVDILESKLAILPGGRDKNGGGIIIMQGDGQPYLVANIGKILSYLSKIPDENTQGCGFTIILDMRQSNWSHMKKALESLHLTFVEHIYHVIIMKPKSLWQRGRTSMNFNIKKSKYKFKCTLLEHSGDLFHHISISQVPKAQGGQLDYDHNQWMETQKIIEIYMLQLISKRTDYGVLQEALEKSQDASTLEEARKIVKHHINLREQLDKSSLDSLCATISHTIARLRLSISNPDFESSFFHLEELCDSLQANLVDLNNLWEKKGDKLDRILQFRIFENDAAQHILWLQDQVVYISRELTNVGYSASQATTAKDHVENYQCTVNSKHPEISRVIEVGQRLISLQHPSVEMINEQNETISKKWEVLTDMIDERIALVKLSASFHSKEDKFIQQSEGWMDECSSKSCPADITSTEDALDKHKKLQEYYTELYTGARQDGHTLIEKLRRPVGEGGVPSDFILAVRHIKEVLESLYDEKNLIDEQWQSRNNHLKMTHSFRIFQKDTSKIFRWIGDIGNPFLSNGTSIGSDVNSASSLLRSHDSFESDTEIPVVYSQCSSLQSRAKDLISNKECRQEEVEAEYKKLEDAINNFAIRLDDRREVLVLAIECFKASDNFMSESVTLSGDIPKDKFEGDNIELEERLSRYKARHNIIHKIALTTIKLWDSLKHRLKSSIVLGEASHCPINYVSATRTLERKMKEIENERERISSICLEREKRWELSLERHKLLKDVSEYFIQLGSWLEGIDPKSDLADNITDAQLQLDIFKRQYNQHEETQEKLLQCGTSINDQIDQLDMEMFGSIDDNIDIKKAVNAVVKEMEEKRERLIKEASPYLNTLQEHVEYHLLDQRSHNLNLMLNQISSSLTKLTGIGQTLQEANSLEEFAKTIQDKINVVSNDIEMFTNSVTDCVNRHHYQSVSLTLLNRSLSEKLSLIKKSMSKKQRVIKSSIEFHTNYNKINSTMEYCQTQFSSRESGKSLMEIDSLQESMRDLKQSMMETADMVKNQAIHLLSILNVPEQNDHKTPNCVSDDSVAKNTTTTTANGTTGTTPRMLVIPKKKPQAQDNKSTNVSRDSDQQIINDLIGKIDGRMNKLKRLWDTRHTRLELSKQVIEFEEEVPRVLKWLDEVGVAHLDRCRDYGRSMEEVEQLLKDFDDFEKKTMTPVSDKVVKLKEMMAHFEENCHYDLNRIRSIGSHLEQRWTSFESDVKTYKSNLNLSLTFQDNLFQGTNWCLQSEQFLHSLDEKINQCDTSKEAESLTAELSVYLTVTKEEQTQRVAKIKEIAGFLHSNPLNELAGQLEQTTNMTMKDFETAQHDLEMLYNKLVQIELEKDKERRLLKQRERVIEELINTEEAYVNDLKLVVETYKPRFISNFLPESLKGKETIVFGNIQWIAEFHLEVVWPQMQTIEDLNYESVARLFIDNAETMTDLYVPYCQNKTDSEELLASHRSYLNRVSSLFGSDIPLSSLLIKPIQRITKYPLLLKDCLKYTKQLGQPTELLEMAVKSVEEIPVQTNNAINLSHLKSEEGLKWHKYGDLLYQGPLLVSEPRLLITSEKERQVFAFENTVVFSRRVEDGQAKFHYEYKFRITLSAAVQVIEFIEGEPCKFALFTSDHRMHLKASSVDVKNQWIRFLRTAVMKHVEVEKEKLRSLTVSGARIRSNAVTTDAISKDLNEKHPKMQMMSMAGRSSSPFSNTRVNMPQIRETSTSPTPVTFDKFKVTKDYIPVDKDQHGLSLKKNQVVEVMEQLDTGRWFIRATNVTGAMDIGWVPSDILEQLPPEQVEEISDEIDQNRRHTTAFTDTASQQVISNLKRVTIGESKKNSKQLLVQPSGGAANKSPHLSPHPSPKRSLKHSASTSPNVSPSPSPTPDTQPSSDLSKSPSRFKRKGVVRRRSSAKSNSSSISEQERPNAINTSSEEDELMELSNHSSPQSPLFPASSPVLITAEEEEEERIKKVKAEEKIRYILAELVETEKEYVVKLEKLVTGFLKCMQEEPNLPELLQGKERMIFGNVAAIYDFHRDVFQGLIDKAKDSQEEIAQCFLEKRSDFKLYVTYCENKPKSESFIWTYTHHGGTFFTEVQKKLGLREDIASFLIKPVQRITKYQLLLKDLLRTSQKAGKEVPLLEEALQLMQDVPKQANDAMALSMIIGYHGNIHANGQIILQDEFTVYEKSRWAGGARRHVFLLDLMMIITKDKDNDGLYEFKDSLKVHNMTLTEKQADNPCRFTVGTGQIGDWDKFYILEASTSEKKQEWIKTIKEILNQQFEMLKALKQPSRARSTTVDNPIDGPAPSTNVIQLPQQASIFHDMSDSSLDEASDEEEQPSPLTRKRSGAMSTSGPDQQEVRKNPPFAKVDSLPGSLPKINAFIVSEDYTPTAEGQKILHIKKGQVYNVMNSNGNWWWGRLIRRVSFGDIAATGAEGWIPHNFLDQFTGQLTSEEQFNCLADKVSQNNSDNKFWTLPSKINKANSVKANSKPDNKKKFSKKKNKQPLNPPQITAGLSDESVLIGQDVQFKCQLAQEYTDQKVEWFLNGKLFSNERAFISSSNICILKIKYVNREDEGLYMCSISSQGQCSSTSAKLTVLGPPDPPGIPRIKQITSTSVSLTWTPPMFDGHSPVTIYLVECKDTLGDRWSTLMKRITEPSTIVDDLIPRMEYVFRVLAGNHIGSSQPSLESKPIKMTHNSSFKPVFSLEPFENHYTLMGQIAKGQYSQVYECLHEATQQIYIAKLLPLSLGSNQCHNELMLLSQISHPNIILMTSAYLTDKHYIIIMKYVNGSPIFDYFMQKKTSTELVVSKCCQQLTDALDYLHQMNIAHLAIKPSNVLVNDVSTDELDLQLVHLSDAKVINKNVTISPPSDDYYIEYNAPEVLMGEPVTIATDMWSVGVLLYTLLTGSSPFLASSLDLTKENITSVNFSNQFQGLSGDAKNVIIQLLQREPNNRIAAKQLLHHQWLVKPNDKSSIDMTRLKE